MKQSAPVEESRTNMPMLPTSTTLLAASSCLRLSTYSVHTIWACSWEILSDVESDWTKKSSSAALHSRANDTLRTGGRKRSSSATHRLGVCRMRNVPNWGTDTTSCSSKRYSICRDTSITLPILYFSLNEKRPCRAACYSFADFSSSVSTFLIFSATSGRILYLLLSPLTTSFVMSYLGLAISRFSPAFTIT